MNKAEIIKNFDPNQPGLADATIFGLPFDAENSEIIVIPVPWEVTVSYGSGASKGPEAILEASYQVDLMHEEFPELWKLGIYFDEIPQELKKNSKKYKKLVSPIIELLEAGELLENHPKFLKKQKQINDACQEMVKWVNERTTFWQNQNKLVVLIGGDHSTPLGYYQALAKKHGNFGILHLDAHLDLRIAYEGFTYSHASIMYNTLSIKNVEKILSVGIRDFCEQEVGVAKKHNKRIKVISENHLKGNQFNGINWDKQCDEIIAQLPEKVCISFDIDGLDPKFCPNTGTPVPGGLEFHQATYLMNKLVASGKTIIGFDLVEVAPGKNDDWDGNVGARMLFHMCGALAKSQKFKTGNPVKF